MSRGGPTGEHTVDYSPPPPPGGGSLTVAAARGPGDDLRTLLRKRLLFFAGLLAAGLVVSFIFLAVVRVPLGLLGLWEWAALGVFALGTAFVPVLRSRRPLSVRQLRAIELVLFGAYYALWAGVHGVQYMTLVIPRPPFWYGFIFGFAVSVPWGFLIIAYGILIPNTGRRCAAVVGVMAVTPLGVSWANGLAAQVTVGHTPVGFYFTVSACMAVAVALAVFGAQRIEVLRREVAAARRLGPYALLRKLGAGGMGEVHLAEHHLLRRPCAVKLIRPDRGGDPASLDRFEQEVQATAALTHPNTVQVYDYGRADDGTFYYAMEYLPGPTLDQLVGRHGPMPPGRAVHLLRQVCGALSEAHAAGLVHRDIKPGNVLVCDRGGRRDVAKLLDFGLVAAGAADAGDGIAGTPAYMPPEQAAGRPADARGDLYGLGAVAYFLLAGQPPFPHASLARVLAAHRSEPAAFPAAAADALPEDVQAVVLRCLAKDPAQRYPDADGLERALAACACATEWTRDEIERWWRERGPGAADDPAPVPPTTRTLP